MMETDYAVSWLWTLGLDGRHAVLDLGPDELPVANCTQATGFDVSGQYDFIVARSVFSHTGVSDTVGGLKSLARNLKDDGVMLAAFTEGRPDNEGEGWFYPLRVLYTRRTIRAYIKNAGLIFRRLDRHGKDTWYAMAKDPDRI